MSSSLHAARMDVFRRLRDDARVFWTDTEVDAYLVEGYRALARETRAIWDLRYAENLPRGMSYTHAWEADLAEFDYGQANYTADFERRLLHTEAVAQGFGNHTSPFEAINGHLSDAGASTAIPATADLPRTVSEIDRAMWDQRAIAVLSPRHAAAMDSRYELTEGEVVALVTQQQGPRTIRKVRVPAEQADAYTVEGSWGVLRDPADASEGEAETAAVSRRFGVTTTWEVAVAAVRGWNTGYATFTAAWEADLLSPSEGPANHTYADEYDDGVEAGLTMTGEGVFGLPRRIPGHHPMGAESFGCPRRVFDDGKNVRIEHWREGRAVSSATDVFELPVRAVTAVRDYAMAQCYGKAGPAQDRRLAAHYQHRYARGVARLQRRVRAQQRARIGQLGGPMAPRRSGPPRPRLPWQYGTVVR